jgi:hypothetical protein
VILIDFDFTLVDYDLNFVKCLDVNNCFLNEVIVNLIDTYKVKGYSPVLFTARGLRSQKDVSRFLFSNNLHFSSKLFLGNTFSKFLFLKFILFFTNSEVVLIDDLSDFNPTTKEFVSYNINDYVRPNFKFVYINPLTYEKN